jgi:hypothetical protein
MTMRRFGDRATFAIEIGGFDGGLRIVDLWAGGKWLSVSDNVSYVPSLCNLMRSSADRVSRGEVLGSPVPGCTPEQVFWLLCQDSEELAESHWFMHWGDGTDNLRIYALTAGVQRLWRALSARPNRRLEDFWTTTSAREIQVHRLRPIRRAKSKNFFWATCPLWSRGQGRLELC